MGCMGDVTEPFCPGPSRLLPTFPREREGVLEKVAGQTAGPQGRLRTLNLLSLAENLNTISNRCSGTLLASRRCTPRPPLTGACPTADPQPPAALPTAPRDTTAAPQ